MGSQRELVCVCVCGGSMPEQLLSAQVVLLIAEGEGQGWGVCVCVGE